MFDGIHLRCVRWNIEQLYVCRNYKLLSFMPCSAVTTQQNQVVRELLGQLIKKDAHPIRIAVWKDQEKGISCSRFDSSISVPIFTNVMARHGWTNTLFAPAVLWLVDSAEPSLILEHQPHFLMRSALLVDIICELVYSIVNFFEVSMTSSLAFFGCLLRGMIFLHPWRCRT